MVTESDDDASPGLVHRIALPSGGSNATAAIAAVVALYAPEPEMTPQAVAAAERDARRATMICSRLQGRLTLGPEVCAQIDAMATDPETPWEMREAILNAAEWRRTSQTIAELGRLLRFDDAQMDALFEAAMAISV